MSHQVRAAAQGQQPGRDGQQGDAVDLPGAAVYPAFDEAQALEQLVG
ncbi:TPA: hypothetical protein SLV84_004848 [Pseudomonas aeruginosa]|nr:hypothetical protein [Pseudomonas aeruginosa]MBH3943385.1 hypothetical protein [Pseudomonas aeruginosa]HEJ2156569.1 hypothetical protein [Pseudomonas aeruginosa]HEK3376743.1 hypothetical protein [Pseudomonas aeruginosa]